MLHASNESLSEILGASSARTDLFTSSIGSRSSRHVAYRSEEEMGSQLPFVLRPESGRVEDFFVDVVTYHQTRAPVSAFMHVLDDESARYFDQRSETDWRRIGLSKQRRYAALGAAVGETFLAALGSSEGGSIPSYSACKRSLSYVLTRSRAIYPDCNVDYVANRWVKLRNLTGLFVSDNSVDAARAISQFLFGSTDGLSATMKQVLKNSVVDSLDEKSIERALLLLYPTVERDVTKFDGPFDDRMKVFGQVVEQVQRTSLGSDIDSMAVAFFCNLIQPGSFAHSKVLAKLINLFPTALVWYGMFCGLCNEFNAANFGAGLIAKLDRDAMQPFSFEARPLCDLSLDELEVLMRLPLKAEVVKASQQKTAIVALLPGVDVSSRYSVDEEQPGDERPQIRSDTDEISSRLTMLLEDALMLVRRGQASARKSTDVKTGRQSRSKR